MSRSSNRYLCVLVIAAVSACGPEEPEPEPEPPSEEDARAILEAFCEQPFVPCNNEETDECVPDQPEYCYTVEQCLDEYFDHYEMHTDYCKVHGLELLSCQTSMSCEEWDDFRKTDQCAAERDAYDVACFGF